MVLIWIRFPKRNVDQSNKIVAIQYPVKFLMKCDDDTFVNVPNLVHFVLGGTIPVYKATFNSFNEQTIRILSSENRLNTYEDLLIGSRFCHSKPISNMSSKW